MPEQNLTPEILSAALQGLEAQRARLESHIAEVRRLLGGRALEPAAAAKTPKPKRRMSAAGRRRMAEAAKKRWVEFRRKQVEAATKAKAPVAAAKTPKAQAEDERRRTQAHGGSHPEEVGRIPPEEGGGGEERREAGGDEEGCAEEGGQEDRRQGEEEGGGEGGDAAGGGGSGVGVDASESANRSDRPRRRAPVTFLRFVAS